MTSPVAAEEQSNTKTEEGTTTFQKKRSRRVSFAENTSVHIFDRDEEYETPPDPAPPNSPYEDLGFSRDNDSKQFFSDQEEGDEDDDMDGFVPRSPFLKVVRSPSSGGSTIGSATSNDEDKFFGPVSTSFIRRDLSDSAPSDDNHEATMDSTAFSTHFCSIARSDSVAELKTSTGFQLSFEKTKTPNSIPYDTSPMLLELSKKPNRKHEVSTSKSSTGSHSNDMSLVGENHDKYDYGKLSPVNDALLAEGHHDLHVSLRKSPIKAGKEISARKGTLTVITKEPAKDTFGFHSSLEFLDTRRGSPSNPANMVYQIDNLMEKENKYPLLRSVTPFTDSPGQILINHASQSKSPGTATPFHNQASAFLTTESQNHGGSVSSLQKSISKLRMLKASPFSAGLNAELQDLNSRSLVGLSKISCLDTFLEEKNISPPDNRFDDTRMETDLEPLLFSPQKREEFSTNTTVDKTKTPSKNTWSGEHMQSDQLNSADTRYSFKDDENKIVSPEPFSCSPMKTTAEFRAILHRDEKHPIQPNESTKCGPGRVGGLRENIINTILCTVASDGMIERRENAAPLEVAGSNIEVVHGRKTFLYDVCNSEMRGTLTTLLNDKEHENLQSNFKESGSPIGQMKSTLPLNGRTDEHSSQKVLADQFVGSPSNKEVYSVMHKDSINSLPVEHVQSSSAKQLPKKDVHPAERKRKIKEAMDEKITRIKRSNSGRGLSSDGEISSNGPNMKELGEIHTKFLKETKTLLHLVDTMNFHVVDRLVDLIGQLQRSKTYLLLSNEIQSQTILDTACSIQHKRVADTKLLLCKVVHEQAKLQLMRVKRGRLLKSMQSLASGVQESEALTLNYSQHKLKVHVMYPQPFSDNMNSTQQLTSMKQAIEDVNTRISNLTKSFHRSCKMKGEPNPADTVAYVNDHMIKRARHQILRKYLQVWVLDTLKSGKDHHDVVLNYLDLITQRLTVITGVAPSISTSIELNKMNIQKNFKNMDAITAFGYVFDVGLTQKHVAATCLAQETQMTSSLLGHLVDVMEEVQLARIELNNLGYARFHTSLEGKLYLWLYFFDSNSQKKATVTLNTSCLKRGIYPSEIISYLEPQNPSSAEPEIVAAVKHLGLGVGFSSILRLCRCISHLLM